MNAELGAVGNRALEAMLNGAFQGLLVAGMLWFGLRVAPGLNAATRYAVQFVAMLIIAALPVIHLAREFWPVAPAVFEPSELPIEEAVAVVTAEEFDIDPVVYERPGREWELTIPPRYSAGLLVLWLLVVSWRLALLARQCIALWWIKRGSLAPADAMAVRFEALRTEMHVRRKVGLRLSQSVHAPIAAGFARPLVLLPEPLAYQETPTRLDGILRHELAHVRRWDDWTNLVQQVIHALLFFHPGVCWLSKRLAVEREIACDDHVLAALSNRRDYALLLAEFASRMHGQPLAREWSAAPGAWSRKGQLKERINMIMNQQRNASTRLAGASAGMLTIGAVLAALLVMQTGPRLALAEEAEPIPQPEPDAVTVNAGPSAGEEPGAEVRIGSGRGVVLVAPPGAKARVATIHAAEPLVAQAEPVVLVAPPGAKARAVTIHRAEPLVAQVEPGEPPHPPHGPMKAKPAAEPKPPRPGRPIGQAYERDLEKRLERLERMVQELAGNRKEQHGDMKLDFQWRGEGVGPGFRQEMENFQWDLKNEFSHEKFAKLHEEARRAAENGVREAERAMREMQHSMRDGKPGEPRAEISAESARIRRKALEEKRRALERQMQALERQIDDIERQEERIEQEEERAQEERERQKERAQRDRERAEQEREKAEQNRTRLENQRKEQENSNNSSNVESTKKRKE